MWTLLLVAAFVVIGLKSTVASRSDGQIALAVTVLVIGYVSVSKHLL